MEKKKLIHFMLAILVLVGTLSTPAGAFWWRESLPRDQIKVIKVKPQYTGASRLYAYTNSSMRSQYRMSSSYIDLPSSTYAQNTDELRIISWTDDSLYGYWNIGPYSNQRYSTIPRWFDKNAFLSKSLCEKFDTYYAKGQIVTYTRTDLHERYGYVGAGDKIWVLCWNGANNTAQVLYPLVTDGEWKIGWIDLSSAAL